MPLEAATYLSQLVTSNPTATDPKSQGDDHLRLLKQVLLNTLPGLNGPINTAYFGSNLVGSGYQKWPTGAILQWGTFTGSGSGYAPVSFPIAFAAQCYAVVGTFQSVSLVQTSVNVNAITSTGFNGAGISNGAYSSQPIFYIAVGR